MHGTPGKNALLALDVWPHRQFLPNRSERSRNLRLIRMTANAQTSESNFFFQCDKVEFSSALEKNPFKLFDSQECSEIHTVDVV